MSNGDIFKYFAAWCKMQASFTSFPKILEQSILFCALDLQQPICHSEDYSKRIKAKNKPRGY